MKFRLSVLLVVLSLVVALGVLFGCSKGAKQSATETGGELVVYSGRKDNLVKPVTEAFEKETGIKVKLLASDASQLANQIMAEKANPRADIYISNDAGGLDFLSEKGALEAYKSKAAEKVASNFKAEDGTWVGASIRARVIMYNTELVKKEDLPKSVFDLADAKWKGKFAFAGSANESMVSNVTALRWLKGEKFTEDFLKKLVANDPVITEGHGDIREAVGKGELQIGWVNHYYYHKQKHEGSPVGVIYPDQGGNDIGTVVNVAGLGIIEGAKNEENAKKFVDFILSPKAQKIFAHVNYELPVLDSVDPGEAKPLKDFKVADVKLGNLGEELDKTMDLLEKVKM